MTATTIFLIAFAVWVLIGVVTSYVMKRRGHDLFSWAVLGAVFGPLVLALAADAVHREPVATARPGRVGRRGSGPVDVLVGLDGSHEARAAVDAVQALLGERVGRLTLAAVVDYDAAQPEAPPAVMEDATRNLESWAAEVKGVSPSTVVLAGRPHEQLARFAEAGGYHLLAIGSRGTGRSKALLGSVASRLARGCQLPVLTVTGSLTQHEDAAATNGSVPATTS